MKNLNSEETLWVILPILLVVALLVASIIILPKTQVENRTKATEPIATPTRVVMPTPDLTTPTEPIEVVCSSLYSPVCSQAGVTYQSECEANKAGVTAFTQGECSTQTPVKNLLPSSN